MILGIQLRQVRYLNNIVEQNHRFMSGFKFYKTATSLF